jgi:hypothetical protein
MPTPHRFAMRLIARISAAAALSASLAAIPALSVPATASASSKQLAMIQDGGQLAANPGAALAKFRALGANTVRVVMFWYEIAPHPSSSKAPAKFDATDPAAYPQSGWDLYDQIDRFAAQDRVKVDFTVAGGAPEWAEGKGIPPTGHNPHYAWKPSAKAYGQFVQAVGKRYSGTYTPAGQAGLLPAVHFWALWNEPNFGEDLAPQATNGSQTPFAPGSYRNLVDAGWTALHQTNHGHDTILIGEFAARGNTTSLPRRHAPQGLPGNYGQTKPLAFIRDLYCVDSSYRQLRGSAAHNAGCPTTGAGSRRFRAANPGLFSASGVGDHPYPENLSPIADGRTDPDFAAFPDIGNLEGVLDHVNRVYGSRTRYSVYNDEYGYITDPPVPPGKHHYVSPTTAADYMNWAEYLSWRSRRIASYSQFLINDPPKTTGIYSGFASGLYFSNGKPKQPVLNGYRLPLWLPKTSVRGSAEVWGEARPASFMSTTPSVAIQLQAHGRGGWSTVDTLHSKGYFDVHVTFRSSGNVRLAYRYPNTDPLLPVGVGGSTITSRTVAITVR